MKAIKKVYFLIHPVTYATFLVDGKVPRAPNLRQTEYMAIYETEKAVRKRQDEFIAGMKDDELLVLYPIGQSGEMLKLEEYASDTLGDRCVILRREPVQPATAEGYLPDNLLLGVSAEIVALSVRYGYDWSARCLKVLYTSRGYACDLQREMIKRHFTVDPLTVESEAFGEGFEECAMTWKGMVGSYLGWTKPTENNYELSVSAAPFLLFARYRERLEVAGDIRLFLWEGADGRPIALYARASFRLADPRYYVKMRFDPGIVVANVAGEIFWPLKQPPLNPVRVEAEAFLLPVFEGARRFSDDQALYIKGRHAGYDEFKQKLLDLKIEASG